MIKRLHLVTSHISVPLVKLYASGHSDLNADCFTHVYVLLSASVPNRFLWATHICRAHTSCRKMAGCPSHASIVSKRLKISSYFFSRPRSHTATPLWFSNTALWLWNYSKGKGSLTRVDLEYFQSYNAEQWPCCMTLWPADTFTPHTIRQPTNCRYFSSLKIAYRTGFSATAELLVPCLIVSSHWSGKYPVIPVFSSVILLTEADNHLTLPSFVGVIFS